MSGQRDVDQLWAQLKAQQAPARRTGPTLSGLAGLPGITSTVRTYDKSRGPTPPAQRPSFIAQLGQACRGHEQDQASSGDHQALLASLQRDINGLSDPERTTRRRAVEKLHAALLAPGASAPTPQALQAVVAGPLLVPLVRLLADPAEKCRELACGFLVAALPRLPEPGALLPMLLPALEERVGSAPPQEASEEMRLALAELMAGPLLGTLAGRQLAQGPAAAAAAAAAPGPSAVLPSNLLPPLCATLCCQLADPYADIKKAACTSVACLAGIVGAGANAMPAGLLQPLLAALCDNLAHQHSRVRLAALQALHALVQCGMPVSMMQDGVLPAVRPLAHDHAPAIRAALFSFVAEWSGSKLAAGGSAGDGEGRAANQCRTFLPLLLPLLLLGLTDEVEAIRSDTFAELEAIGATLAKHKASSSAAAELIAVDQPGVQLPGYCHPFSGARPSAATCWLVQAQLTRLLQQCLAELREWTATLRVSAARLLHATLIYGEDEALPLLPSILLALRGAVSDDDAGVATQAVACVHVLGVNLPPRHWMALSTEAVAAEQQSPAQRTAALVVLSALLHAASKADAAVESESLQLAAGTLSSSELAAAALAADGGALRLQLLAACFNLVRWAGLGSAAVASQLFQLLLQLQAAELDSLAQASASEQAATAATTAASTAAAATAFSSAGPLTAAGVLAELAAALGRASAADLCDLYGPAMLQRCVQNHEQWTHTYPGWRTAAALLRLSGSGALLQLWPTALPALQGVAADHERDPRLRLELLHLVAALLEDDSKAEAWPQAGVGQQLVASILAPALVWRAGRVAAAARYAALTGLAALLARQHLPPGLVAEVACASEAGDASLAAVAEAAQERGKPASLLARMAGCLDEEYEPDTRQLACHALALLLDQVGPQLPAVQLAVLQPALLARLDDSTNRVRVAACAALRSLLASLLAPVRPAGGLAEADAAALASSMLIHLDDPDDEVAQAVCCVLCQLATAAPGVVRPLAQAAAAQHLHASLLDQVLAACGGAPA